MEDPATGPEDAADDVLLTTPGRREDLEEAPTLQQGTPYEKRPFKRSKGSATRHSQGPAKRELNRQVRGPEFSTSRKLKGHGAGAVSVRDLKSLVGLEENNKPTYTRNEQVLFENTTKVRMLVEQMESKGEKKDEA